MEVVPYRSLLMVLPPSVETGIDEGGLMSKEFDDFEEDDSFEDERKGIGLQNWNANYE